MGLVLLLWLMGRSRDLAFTLEYFLGWNCIVH